MLTALLLLLIVTLFAAGLHYYFSHSKTPDVPYQNESLQLRTMQSESERRDLQEAEKMITAVRNRRESRRNSFEEASGEFVNLKHVRLARALSCDSFDENSDEESSDYVRHGASLSGGASAIATEIPDIRAWIKNPTDFFRVRRASQELDGDDKPWSPKDPLSIETPVTQPQILISVSYLPTAERLSVVIVRTKIPQSYDTAIRFICAKARVTDDRNGRRTNKKKTSLKALDVPMRGCITTSFNELMIFKLPISMLTMTTVRISCFGYGGTTGGGGGVSVSNQGRGSIATGELLLHPENHLSDNLLVSRRRSSFSHRKDFPACVSLGFVDLGANSNHSSAVTQFTTMMTSMRKPITCWHVLQPKVVKRKSIAGSPRHLSYGQETQIQPVTYPVPQNPIPVFYPVLSSSTYSGPSQAVYASGPTTAYTSVAIDPAFHYGDEPKHMFVNS